MKHNVVDTQSLLLHRDTDSLGAMQLFYFHLVSKLHGCHKELDLLNKRAVKNQPEPKYRESRHNRLPVRRVNFHTFLPLSHDMIPCAHILWPSEHSYCWWRQGKAQPGTELPEYLPDLELLTCSDITSMSETLPCWRRRNSVIDFYVWHSMIMRVMSNIDEQARWNLEKAWLVLLKYHSMSILCVQVLMTCWEIILIIMVSSNRDRTGRKAIE